MQHFTVVMDKLRAEAKQAFAAKNYGLAAELYGQALEINPNDPVVLSNRSQCYINLENWAQAMKDSSDGLQLNPTPNVREKLLFRKSIAAKQLGQLSVSVSCLRELLEFSPSNTAAQKELQVVTTLCEDQQLQSALKKHKALPKSGQVPIAVVDSLPEKYANIVNPQSTQPKTPKPLGDADAVTRASEELFLDRPKKASSPPKESTTFVQRPAMLRLSVLNNLPPEVKSRAFKPILELSEEEILELGSVEPEFLQLFVESVTYGLANTSAPASELLRKLEVVLSLSRFTLALQMCDPDAKSALIKQADISLPDLSPSFAKLLK